MGAERRHRHWSSWGSRPSLVGSGHRRGWGVGCGKAGLPELSSALSARKLQAYSGLRSELLTLRRADRVAWLKGRQAGRL